MKKYFIPFSAFVFAGTFDDIEAAAEAYQAGSSDSFDQTVTDKSNTLAFTDANGSPQTLSVGDAIVGAVDAQGAPSGLLYAPASVVATWTEVADAPAPAADAAAS